MVSIESRKQFRELWPLALKLSDLKRFKNYFTFQAFTWKNMLEISLKLSDLRVFFFFFYCFTLQSTYCLFNFNLFEGKLKKCFLMKANGIFDMIENCYSKVLINLFPLEILWLQFARKRLRRISATFFFNCVFAARSIFYCQPFSNLKFFFVLFLEIKFW